MERRRANVSVKLNEILREFRDDNFNERKRQREIVPWRGINRNSSTNNRCLTYYTGEVPRIIFYTIAVECLQLKRKHGHGAPYNERYLRNTIMFNHAAIKLFSCVKYRVARIESAFVAQTFVRNVHRGSAGSKKKTVVLYSLYVSLFIVRSAGILHRRSISLRPL